MKIAVFDPYGGKFTGDMVDWWRNRGNEVRTDRYYDPELVVWADIIWFDTCDNNLFSATNPGEAILGSKFFDNRQIPWDMHDMDLSGKRVVVRPIDIEVWQGHHAHENMWDVVNDCIFIAPHIRDMMMLDSRPQQSNMRIHTIPCGVDLDHWAYRERKAGYEIAVIAERWVSKGVDYMLQIALKLKEISPQYHITWLGVNNDYHWEHEYLKDFIRRNELNVTLEEAYVDNLDLWLDNFNYLLSCSKKEAFGYSIAEAMAKGIKPIIHEFYGSSEVWAKWTWKSIDEAVKLITESSYKSYNYREYLISHRYTLDQMMESIMEVLC